MRPRFPAEAVIWDGEQAVVWVEREPMVLQRRKIRVGMEQDGRLQISRRAQLGRARVSAARYSCKNELDQ